MEPAAPVVLEYSVPTEGERRWGPFLFRPSRLTVLLVLLTCATYVWLVRRHLPWGLIATLPCDYQDSPHRRGGLHATFTPDGLLLFDSAHGARLYDPATGALRRTVLPTLDRERYRYYAFTHSRHVLAFTNTEGNRVGGPPMLYDFDGNAIATYPELGRDDNQIVISPARPTVIYRGLEYNRTPLLVRDLTSTHREIRLYRPDVADSDFRLQDLRFSPDGTRAMVSHWAMPEFRTCYMEVFDLRTGRKVALPLRRDDRDDFAGDHGFVASDEVWFSTRGRNGRTGVVEFYTLDGNLSRRVTATATSMIMDLTLSDDGRLVATSGLRSRPEPTVEVRDTHTGNVLTTRSTVIAKVWFFPGSHRFLTGHPSAKQHVIADHYHDQPLAVLPAGSMPAYATRLVISPDGRTIVACGDPALRTVVIYRKTGWDCPESHLGALAFLHVSLLGMLFVGAVVSAARDARRARADSAEPPPGWLPHALILVVLPVTLYFIIAAALGRWTVSPAPVLLLAGVGLVTHSRFWRLVTLVLLAATLGWCIYLLNTVRLAGVKQASLYPLLDREYVVPHVVPAVALGLAIALCAIALYGLARRSRVPALAAPAS